MTFLAGVAKEDVPVGLAIDLLEVAAVGVIADPHAVGFELLGKLGEFLGELDPLFLGGVGVGIQPRHDDVLVADGAVELDGLVELVGLEGVVLRVRAAADQAVVVEHLADIGGLVVVVAGELDALVAHVRHGLEHAGQVLFGVLADRVQLQADGDLAFALPPSGPGPTPSGFPNIPTPAATAKPPMRPRRPGNHDGSKHYD